MTCTLVARHRANGDALLYVVGTPIGNMEDITLRALRILREVSLIAAEDTRTTRRLLQRYNIKTRLTSFHDHSGEVKLQRLLEHMKAEALALVSEAGTPNISDPGHDLIAAAIENSIPVVSIPGPTAAISALSTSGLPTSQFTFVGFLPRKASERRKLLASVLAEGRTVVAYEAPHRLASTLDDIESVEPDVQIAVCRELTKLHEEVRRGPITEMLEHFTSPRGEFVLVVAGAAAGAVAGNRQDESGQPEDAALQQLSQLRRSGARARDAVAEVVTSTGLPRKEVYRLWLQSRDVDS